MMTMMPMMMMVPVAAPAAHPTTRTAPHITCPNAARVHVLVSESTRRQLSAHETHELKRLRRTLGTKEFRRRESNALRAARWGWA
jgi:hypothetical protein